MWLQFSPDMTPPPKINKFLFVEMHEEKYTTEVRLVDWF
jgi:hypothetical protein